MTSPVSHSPIDTAVAGQVRSPTSVRKSFIREYSTVVALTVVPVLALAVLITVLLTDREQELVLASLQREAAAAAIQLDRSFGRHIAGLRVLAGSRALDVADLRTFYMEAQRALETQPEWYTITLSEPDTAIQLINLLRPLGSPLPAVSDLPSHQKAVRIKQPIIVARPTLRGPVSGRPVYGVRIPVLREGNVIYVLSAGIKEELFTQALDRLHLESGWGGGVLDERGIIVQCRGCPAGSVGQFAQPIVRKYIADRRTEIGRVTSLSGVPSYFALGRAPLSGWVVATRVPVTKVRDIWLHEMWVVSIAAVFSVVLALGSLAWLTRRRRDTEHILEARVQERTSDLQRTLAQRDALLGEVYHRVKNNLQVINSLMGIYGSRLVDPNGREAIEDLRRRVQALSIVHQQLMSSSDYATLDMKPYLEHLCADLGASLNVAQRNIQLRAESDRIRGNLEFATPMGLLISELLTRCLKQDYPSGGFVAVSLHRGSQDEAALTITDNGQQCINTQLNKPNDPMSRIVYALVRQLGGELQILRDGSTSVVVRLKLPVADD